MQAEVLLFRDGPVAFALRLHEVKEIINLRRVMPLPFAAPHLLGLVHARGAAIPIVSPYLLSGGKGSYVGSVDYAAVVEADGTEVAVASAKILGVKGLELGKPQNVLATPLKFEGKPVRLLHVGSLVREAAGGSLHERYSIWL